MNTHAIIVVGTPQGFWTRWVGHFLKRLEHARIHAELPSSDALGTVLGQRQEAKALVLVEHPATGLARVLADGGGCDPKAWLDDWSASGRALLAHAHRHPDECLLVNADDARRYPEQLAQLIRVRWGDTFTPESCEVAAMRVDALADALAWSFVDRALAVQDVAEELLASCVVLPEAESVGSAPVFRACVDGSSAAMRLSELLDAERRLARGMVEHDTERSELKARLDEAERALTAARTQAEGLTPALERMRVARDAQTVRANEAASSLNALRLYSSEQTKELQLALSKIAESAETIEVLRAELTAARDALDAQEVERRSLEARADTAEARQREVEAELLANRAVCDEKSKAIQAAMHEGEVLLEQLHQAQEALARAHLSRRDVEGALGETTRLAGVNRLEQELRTAREECELMSLQMDQIQRELERVHDENRRLSLTAAVHDDLSTLDDVSIGEVTVTNQRDTPPHREVSFVLRNVSAGARRIAEASVRLVEHWGRPGLAIFADSVDNSLFAAWRETGREDGRPYMLLVHGEESTQRILDSMGTIDWRLLQLLATRLHRSLQSKQADASKQWASIAQRLLGSLLDEPTRLRHEKVQVVPMEQGNPHAASWGMILERASFGSRTWPQLAIHWRPDDPNPYIELLVGSDGSTPLLAWPTDLEGRAFRAIRLPIGEDPNAPEIRAAWGRLAGTDKNFLAALLGLLPMLAVHIQASAADHPLPDLQAAARLFVRFGRAALAPSASQAASVIPGTQLFRRLYMRLRSEANSTAPMVSSAIPTAVTSDADR